MTVASESISGVGGVGTLRVCSMVLGRSFLYLVLRQCSMWARNLSKVAGPSEALQSMQVMFSDCEGTLSIFEVAGFVFE